MLAMRRRPDKISNVMEEGLDKPQLSPLPTRRFVHKPIGLATAAENTRILGINKCDIDADCNAWIFNPLRILGYVFA
jgi:hypothetical protein